MSGGGGSEGLGLYLVLCTDLAFCFWKHCVYTGCILGALVGALYNGSFVFIVLGSVA